MYTIETIVDKLKQLKPELVKKYPVTGIGVFGSYARGEATGDSDIDIAVDIDGPMGLNFVAMADEIEALFGIKTDVIPKRSVKPEYLPYIEKDIIYVWKKTFCIIGDILNCIKHIGDYTGNLSFDEFSSDFMVVEACLYNIQIIGEAVWKLAEEVKKNNPDIPWVLIKGMRNRLIHDYIGTDLQVVWNIIINELPSFAQRLQQIYASLLIEKK